MKRIKLICFMRQLMTVFLSFFCVWICQAFTVNNIYYVSSGKNAKVIQNPYMNGFTNVKIPPTVTFEGKTYTVTEIDRGAFESCRALTTVTIPKTVKVIRDDAFKECSALTDVTIPNSVTEISDRAFYKCASLTSVTIPSSVIRIGYEAFSDCYSLENISMLNPATEIGSKAFNKTTWYMNQPNGVIYIGKAAYAYKGEMPSGTNVAIKDGTVCISDGAFSECRGLTSISIPKTVTSIGFRAFENCDNLKSVDIPDSFKEIGNGAFKECTGLTSVTIPNSVITIGYEAFKGCKNLNSIIIPNSVTDIGSEAFFSCSNLKSVIIGNSVTKIGKDAFYGCQSLKKLTIPESVKKIDYSAFANCFELTDVYCFIRNPWPLSNSIEKGAFIIEKWGPDYTKRTLHVPVGCKMFHEEFWGSFFGSIVEMDGSEPSLNTSSLDVDDSTGNQINSNQISSIYGMTGNARDYLISLNPDEIRELGDSYADNEDYIKAAGCYQHLIDNGNYKTNDFFTLSNYYLGIASTESLDDDTKADALAKSQKYIDEVDKLVPGNVLIVNQKAKIAKFREGENINGAALGAYNELLSILNQKENKADYARYYKYAYNYLATYYYNTGDYTLAKVFYQKWLEYDPENEVLRRYVESLEP